MLEFPHLDITKSRTADIGTSTKRARRGNPNRISRSYKSHAIVRSSESQILFMGRLFFSWREHVCVEQVLAVPICYFALLAAGKKLVCRLFVLLVSWEKEK